MPETLASQTAAPGAPKGLLARAVGVLTSPRATYADVALRPRWFGVLGLVLVVSGGSLGLFLSTEVGQEALIDRQITTMESFGMHLSDAEMQRLESSLAYTPYISSIGQGIALTLAALVIAGLAFAAFSAFGGGAATFRQVFAIVAHSGVVVALQQLFVLPLDYARASMSNPTSLAVFLPMIDETSFPSRLLGAIDLFVIWWALALAIGLGVLYKRRTAPIALTILGVYMAIAVAIAAVRSAFSGV